MDCEDAECDGRARLLIRGTPVLRLRFGAEEAASHASAPNTVPGAVSEARGNFTCRMGRTYSLRSLGREAGERLVLAWVLKE